MDKPVVSMSLPVSLKLQVATSVAARGLDVKHLILVVNYDCPNHYEDYVHRCGYVCTLSAAVVWEQLSLDFSSVLNGFISHFVQNSTL